MEGCPIFSEHAHLIGILARPLRQKASGAEIQVISKHLIFLLTILNFVMLAHHAKRVKTLAFHNSW